MRRTLIAALLLSAGPLLAGPPAPEPPHTPGRPDLTVRVELLKEKRINNWYVRMRFTVSNTGLAPVTKRTTLGFWCIAGPGVCPPVHVPANQFAPALDPPPATSVVKLNTPEIPVGQSVVLLGPETDAWKQGNYTIRAKADLELGIIETNEANNIGSAVIDIPKP
ncbi:MAG: hypothetical protein NEA02_13300 [Thermoanaerobaculia bacterium]|nr:hypothetical protein [Thermoanaerobaculia bacterium]